MARSTRRYRAAAIQMTSTTDVDRNVARAIELVRAAADDGARLVTLPENFAYLRKEGKPTAYRQTLDGDLVREMAAEARRARIHLLLGSIPEGGPRQRKIRNTSVLLGPDGKQRAVYRKIHLFDIAYRGRAELLESRTVEPGRQPVVADTRIGRFGLSICYDVRFPELYRHLALAGAEILLVPAAFTAFTGPHHWLPLLRARAIENQCWVIAPAQVGRHDADRHSHGESVIIDPWGTVVARKPRGVGWVAAELDRNAVERTRRGLPCLEHLKPRLLGRRSRTSGGLPRL